MILNIITSAGTSANINSNYLNQQIQLKLNNTNTETKVIELGFFELFDLFLKQPT